MMTLNSHKTAILLAALLGLAAVQPVARAQATSPNSINNQTVQLPLPSKDELGAPNPGDPPKGDAGLYDRYDHLMDQQGFPLPGEAQLWGGS